MKNWLIVFFVICILISTAFAAGVQNVCGNGKDEASMRCRGELISGAAATLAVPTEQELEGLSLNSVEKIISERLTPWDPKRTIECSFKCNHKQNGFNGCYCQSEVRYNTSLAECPSDVTTVTSTALKWAYDECQAIKCDCPTIDDTVADQRTLFAFHVLEKKQPIRKNANIAGFFAVIQKTFKTEVLGYKPPSFWRNMGYYVARAARKVAQFLKLAKVAEVLKLAVSLVAQGVKNAFNAVKDFITSAGRSVVNFFTKNTFFKSVGSYIKQKFGAAGRFIVRVWNTGKKVAAAAKKAFIRVFDAIKKNPIVKKMISGVKKVIGLAKNGIKRLGAAAKKLGIKLGKGLKKGLSLARAGIKKVGQGIKVGFLKARSGLKKIGNGVKKGWNKAKNNLKRGLGKAKSGLKKLGSGLKKRLGKAKNGLKKLGKGFKKNVNKAKNGIKKISSNFKKGFGGLKRGLGKFGKGVTGGFKLGFSKAKSEVKQIGTGIKKSASKVAKTVGSTVSKATKKVGSAVSSAKNAVRSFMRRI